MSTIDFSTVEKRYIKANELHLSTGDTLQVFGRWMLAAGEYASEGQPDLIVTVPHALDSDGNDVSEQVAEAIVNLLREKFSEVSE